MAVPCLRSPGQLHGRRAGRRKSARLPVSARVGDSNSAARGSGGHAAFCHRASGRTHSLRTDGAALTLPPAMEPAAGRPDAAAIRHERGGAWRGMAAGALRCCSRPWRRMPRRRGAPRFWRYGISGDLPIIVRDGGAVERKSYCGASACSKLRARRGACGDA